ncbi:xanthine dehydrogenase family protein molybdopterin-binding subunit [Aliiglaciecola sp. LCG003]|uniref:xanthine dehydrogenase family protein molybdopterin-binding subunit n=1 Tax=Aliiglaciecola sp. LCG003 TaxID=3053655 RepID=UPI0025736578|nr:xanthine dehydrogenase family protein molybdopterin-binding subunit [Aliiglaciecola sp. LCG003]WJG08090.1 xanthine dehydrogenase family protein molybdopterin-binding subunit [Aliiglaciecola sp. LCG003]
MTITNSKASFSIGQAMNRTDGPAKVQGQATYAAEHQLDAKPLIGWVVTSKVASGQIESIDASKAEQSEGVSAVLNYTNSPAQLQFGKPEDEGRFTQSRAMLNDTKIRYFGWPVALVIANTLEQARYAASLVEVKVRADKVTLFTQAEQAQQTPDELDGGLDADASAGDIASALAGSDQSINVTYQTPSQVSAAMEPHACIANYDGTNLTVYTSIQFVATAVEAIATTLNMDKSKVRIICPYVGGGFGSKLGVHAETILACLGAIHMRCPVKVVATRRQVFHLAPHRGNSYQDMRLGVMNSGHLSGIEHKSYMPMARGYAFAEPTGAGARSTYQADAISSTHRVKEVDMPTIDSTRSPGDAIGSLAFESAIDELAKQIDMDPVEFRMLNMPTKHPISGLPFSSHQLKACLQTGAQKFGWQARNQGNKDNDEEWLTGFGVASAIRMNMITPCSVKLELSAAGNINVSTDMTDVGTGTYTILTQIVSDFFSLATDRIQVDLGNSHSPESCGSGGSFGASSCGSATLKACKQLNEKIQRLCFSTTSQDRVILAGQTITLPDSEVNKTRAVQLDSLKQQLGGGTIQTTAHIEPGQGHEDYEQFSYGAHFAKVEVNKTTGEVKLIKQLGVFSAGRILNSKTAASQLKGGMVWGAGYALREELYTDTRDGSFINCDFAEYHLPVNRDIGEVEVHFIEEPDYKACELGSKGIGELGITGAGAAIANAVADATGVRVRSFPITLDKLFPAFEDS